MARQLDAYQLQCDAGHGRPVVAMAANTGGAPGPGPWFACCEVDLAVLDGNDDFVWFRFRVVPAPPADTADDGDDPALKFRAGDADNNNS